MKNKKILPDGSIEGETFSGDNYKGEYPSPKIAETFEQYRSRVNKCRDIGFNLADLSWVDWGYYCMGSGSYEGVCSTDKIFDNDNSN